MPSETGQVPLQGVQGTRTQSGCGGAWLFLICSLTLSILEPLPS